MLDREASARAGHALPDGSFPIETERDLHNAVQAVGRAKDYERAKRHIIKRARALGKLDTLPESWNVTASAMTFSRRVSDEVSGMYEAGDISEEESLDALALIASARHRYLVYGEKFHPAVIDDTLDPRDAAASLLGHMRERLQDE